MKENLIKIKDFFFNLLGIYRNSKYVRGYLNEASIRSGVFMAIVIVILEIWMILRRTFEDMIPYISANPNTDIGKLLFDYTSNFWLMLFVGLGLTVFCLTYFSNKLSPKADLIINSVFASFSVIWGFLIFIESFSATNQVRNIFLILLYVLSIFFGLSIFGSSLYRFKKKENNQILAMVVITLFASICLVFGMKVSYSDYYSGKEIMCFLTMSIYVGCLLIWKPYVSIGLLGSIFLGFYFLIKSSAVKNPAYLFQPGDEVNYITFFISLTMICISIYNQRVREARKDENLERIANYDSLVDIHSSNHFMKEMEAVILNPNLEIGTKIYLFMNIDDFKIYNDQKGFKQGSLLLKEIGRLINSYFDPHYTCRLSDDHFLALADVSTFKDKVDRLHEDVASIDKDIRIEIKFGGYVFADRDEDPHLAIDKARYACSVISNRRDKYYLEFDKKMHDAFYMKQYVVNNIDNAIEQGWIKAYYQPVVWANDSKLCGCEALARWIDPVHGFMNPGQFVPVLEDTHLIHKLDTAILENVCRDIRDALDKKLPIVPISINFSRLDFKLMDAVSVLEETVKKYNVPKQLLHVEITESALIDDLGALNKAIARLREQGYALWLDDFGSGYSSFNVLKDYEFDVLKIDMKFLSGFNENEKSRTLIKSVIDMADDIGMKTLTEGVETKEEMTFLKDAGCGRLQGYLFGKPLPRETLLEDIAKGKYVVSNNTL